MAGLIDARLTTLGIRLPIPLAPMANYVPYAIAGNLVFVSGQLPMLDGKLAYAGKVGVDLSPEDAWAAARQCFVNVLAQMKAACGGDLDRVTSVVRLGGFVNTKLDFADHALIMNGASDLAVAVFGDAGRHARSTVGVASLPVNAAVEVEGLFQID